MHAGGEGLKEVAAPRSEDFRALFVFISEEASLFRFVSCSKAPTAKEGWYRRICSFGKGREAEICDWITRVIFRGTIEKAQVRSLAAVAPRTKHITIFSPIPLVCHP